MGYNKYNVEMNESYRYIYFFVVSRTQVSIQ